MSESTLHALELEGRSVVIDRAAPADAEAIMTIKRDAWLASYVNEERGITTEDISRKFSDEEMPTAIENWQRGIAGETEDGERATFVARVDGKVVGYTAPRIEDGKRRVGALYVSLDATERGIGGRLLQRALEWHGPDKDVYIQVVSYNEDAIRFYERRGFQRTGLEIPEMFDEQEGIKLLPTIEMVFRAGERLSSLRS